MWSAFDWLLRWGSADRRQTANKKTYTGGAFVQATMPTRLDCKGMTMKWRPHKRAENTRLKTYVTTSQWLKIHDSNSSNTRKNFRVFFFKTWVSYRIPRETPWLLSRKIPQAFAIPGIFSLRIEWAEVFVSADQSKQPQHHACTLIVLYDACQVVLLIDVNPPLTLTDV